MTDELDDYRNRHNRQEHHFGDLPATLVVLSESLGIGLTEGMTLEEAVAILHEKLTYLEDHDIVNPVTGNTFFYASAIVKALRSASFNADARIRFDTRTGSFTANAIRKKTFTVPTVEATYYTFSSGITGWSSANWSGYVGNASISWITTDGSPYFGALRIDPTGINNGATLGTINGTLSRGYTYRLTFAIKRQSGTGNVQWGFGSATVGTSRNSSVNQSISSSWVTKTLDLTPTVDITDPVVWIAAWGTTTQVYMVDEVLVVQRPSILANATIKKTTSGSFTADAWVDGDGVFAIPGDAVIKKTMTGGFTADAMVEIVNSASFTADAMKRVVQSASLTANAVVKATASATFTADAVIKTAQSASFTADAYITTVTIFTFTADAVVKATQAVSFTADAVIEAEDDFSAVFGEIVFGETVFGDT